MTTESLRRRRHRRPAVALTVALLAGATLASACGGGSDRTAATTSSGPVATSSPTSGSVPGSTSSPGASTTKPTSATTAPSTTKATTTTEPTTTTIEGPPFLAPGATAQQNFPGTNAAAALTAVRLGHHSGYDRVVFEFRAGDQLPGYLVDERTPPITADPSDLPLAITGDRAVIVRMQAASRVDMNNNAVPVYTGPTTISDGAGVVTEIVLRGDFEALLSWAIGIRGSRPFRVTTLTGPPRIVVDIATTG